MKECCKNPENRERLSDTQERCKICGAKHYKIKAESGRLGVRLSSLGK